MTKACLTFKMPYGFTVSRVNAILIYTREISTAFPASVSTKLRVSAVVFGYAVPEFLQMLRNGQKFVYWRSIQSLETFLPSPVQGVTEIERKNVQNEETPLIDA